MNFDFDQMAKDMIHIVDSMLDKNHSNGNACEWGGALIRLALLKAQNVVELGYPGGDACEHVIRYCLEGVTMGGSGNGSKYNTRCCYIPVSKVGVDNVLENPNFEYYNGYLVDYVHHRIKNNLPIASTKIRHDSGVVIGNVLIFVHEAESCTVEEEKNKVVLGLARMMPYMTVAYGIVTNVRYVTWYSLTLDDDNGELVLQSRRYMYYDQIRHSRTDYLNWLISHLNKLAEIFFRKGFSQYDYLKIMENSLDNPGEGRNNFQRKKLREYECVFSMDPASDVEDDMKNEVILPAMEDIREKKEPYLIGKKNEEQEGDENKDRESGDEELNEAQMG